MSRKEILHQFMEEVWNLGDREAVEKYVSEPYRIHHDPGDPWDGKSLTLDEFKNRLDYSRTPFPDGRFEVQDFFEDEDAVVINWLWSGTHLGDLGPFPASGRVITMSGLTVYSFEADRITGHWQVVDRLGVFQQLKGG